jgi:NADPH-dependent ferric siderophore reductase
MDEAAKDRVARIRPRREPPPLLPVEVTGTEAVSPRLMRLTVEGSELRDLVIDEPAASVRLLVPPLGHEDLVMPTWNGNEFLLPDGSRPALRTFTPLRFDPGAGRLDLEIVRHPGGAVSTWAEGIQLGAPAAISGPGRGYEIDLEASRYLLFGDETALAAIGQLLGALPPEVPVDVHLETVTADAQVDLPGHPARSVTWHVAAARSAPGASLVAAARAEGSISDGTHIWAAGEAASMQAIRKFFFDEAGVARRQATIRGYWKPARTP